MNKQKAIVTGATSGIGKEFCQQLSKDYDLILVARDKQRLDSMSSSLTGKHQVIACDLTDASQLAKLIEELKQIKDISLLVNNAGMGTYGEFASSDIDKEISQVDLNITSLTRLTHYGVNNFGRESSIINVASVAGFVPAPFNAVYCATKAYVKSFTAAIQDEVKDKGIYMQTLCPGFTKTEFHERGEMDVNNLPDFMWSSASEVVRESIEAMHSKVNLVVPGILNKSTALLGNIVPDSALTGITSFVMKQGGGF